MGYKLQIPFPLDLNAHKYLKSLAVFPRIRVNHSPFVIKGGLGSDGSSLGEIFYPTRQIRV